VSISRRIFVLPVSFFLVSAIAPSRAQEPVKRPPITGVARVQISVTNVTAARDFYEKTLRLPRDPSACNSEAAMCLAVNDHQQIQLVAALSPTPTNLIAAIVFATPDVAQMRRYLVSKGLTPDPISVDEHRVQHFGLRDPEGHTVSFLQQPISSSSGRVAGQTSSRLIHAGFIVRDRLAEDHFYQDILGFHLYWQGGMKDGETSWVSMQVPDGTDWLEYMLNISPDASHHTIGVMNHVALGVTDIRAVRGQLLENGWKPAEEPKIGRDGKWQLNLYDPDDTRVEFMELKPVEKPCCSEFTGTHPTL